MNSFINSRSLKFTLMPRPLVYYSSILKQTYSHNLTWRMVLAYVSNFCMAAVSDCGYKGSWMSWNVKTFRVWKRFKPKRLKRWNLTKRRKLSSSLMNCKRFLSGGMVPISRAQTLRSNAQIPATFWTTFFPDSTRLMMKTWSSNEIIGRCAATV